MLLGKPFIPTLRPLLAEQSRALSLIHRAAINGIKESLGKPKRGPNGYSLFYQEKYEEMRSQFPNFGVVDIARRAGSAWKTLATTEQKKYSDRAAKLNEQNKIDMEAYQKNLTQRQKLARLALFYHRKYSRGEIKRSEIPADVKDFVKGLPAAPFMTGRAMFLASKLRGHGNATEMLVSVNKEWERLAQQEKKIMEDRAAADQAAFQDYLKKYLEESG